MVRLSVNVNKVATLRNARGGSVPDVVRAARAAVAAGCHGITVHPRPDGRHIRHRDVLDLAAALTVELNIEGYPSAEFLDLVCRVRPAQCTLVPDAPDAHTSNAGWALGSDLGWLAPVIARLHEHGIRVSLFADPIEAHMAAARGLGADRVELYTERYARAFETPDGPAVFETYRRAAVAAGATGLGLNAGHDLDLVNLPYLARHLPGLLEVSIGHALVADALFLGLDAAVRAYLDALR
ncbi:MAG TPA: pyridoxine 5'-phosphate synthase [Candidatus Eisenbacteria bacterium]|nr:pyridoxine 5'-phosphate synthase [Candidatus Eisenbacteria bacterium]